LVIGCKLAERGWLENKEWSAGPDDHEASFWKTSGQSRSIGVAGASTPDVFATLLEHLDVADTAKGMVARREDPGD
jgi:hypothetical protein